MWIGWRQVRLAALALAVLAAAAIVYFVLAGLYARNAFTTGGVAACIGAPSSDSACGNVIGNFLDLVAGERAGGTGSDALSLFLGLAPGLLGVFLGAPLLPHEYEQGTHRLAWTQSVSRTRWLATRLAITGAVAVLAELALSLAMTFQRGPIDQVYGSIDPGSFDFEGLVPIGYAAFAFLLGVWLGGLIRRTVPAMATTLVGFLVVKYLIQDELRPHYLPPIKFVSTPNSPLYSTGWMVNNSTGAYQPNDRFWTFQLIEFGIYLALTAVLVALTFRSVRTARARNHLHVAQSLGRAGRKTASP